MHAFFFFKFKKGGRTTICQYHLIMQICANHKMVCFQLELIVFLWKNPGKWILWCDLSTPRSIMIKVELFLWWVFRGKYLYISEKSVFTCKFTLLHYIESSCGIALYFFITDISISFYFFLIYFSVLLSSWKPTNIESRPNF